MRGSKDGTYIAEVAQAAYKMRGASYKSKGWFSPEVASQLEVNLQHTWSPEQIAEHRRVNGKSFVCFKTIYRWFYVGRALETLSLTIRHYKNALEASDVGKSVSVTANRNNKFIEIKIIDEGSGMSEDEVNLLGTSFIH